MRRTVARKLRSSYTRLVSLLYLLSISIPVLAQNDTLRRMADFNGTRFIQERPFNEPDTVLKARIMVSSNNTTQVNVINGFALIERKEWGWMPTPPFGVDGWTARLYYDRTYRIVRVKQLQDANKLPIDSALVWGYKFINW